MTGCPSFQIQVYTVARRGSSFTSGWNKWCLLGVKPKGSPAWRSFSMIDGFREPCESTDGNPWSTVAPPGNKSVHVEEKQQPEYRDIQVFSTQNQTKGDKYVFWAATTFGWSVKANSCLPWANGRYHKEQHQRTCWKGWQSMGHRYTKWWLSCRTIFGK